MTRRSLRILQVSTADIGGGAEMVAWNLFQSYRTRGYGSWLAVGRKCSDDPDVLAIPNHRYPGAWHRLCLGLADKLKPFHDTVPGVWRARAWLDAWRFPCREIARQLGIENFNFPGTRRILQLAPHKPDIIDCHNLHGNYFDLRALPWLSHQRPVVLTLHDAWLLSGHCSHSLDCERWKTSCGRCPDLSTYPAIQRDATAYNWRRKENIFAKSRFYVTTPSEWLMRKVKESILGPVLMESRVIPNGVDLSVFNPSARRAARTALNLPHEPKMLLSTAYGGHNNPWKDYQTMRVAVARLADRMRSEDLIFVALGEHGPDERIGGIRVYCIPYQKDPKVVAGYYQAADVYLHAARADTFPNAVLEALACGTPVVATAVGGIPEQVKGLKIADGRLRSTIINRYAASEATGVLVSQGNAEDMAIATESLLKDDMLRRRLGENAAKDAMRRFDQQRQADDFLRWYDEIVRRPESQSNIA